MPTAADIAWFKTTFQAPIAAAIAGTPLTVDMLAALACQETGEIWPVLLAAKLPTARILALCVGDTIDNSGAKGRQAFPRNKKELLAAARGQDMFAIARTALVDMAEYIAQYRSVARQPDKFCHGFGLFQRDLQYFQTDPDYFLEQRYANFDDTLRLCLKELAGAVARLHLQGKAQLSDMEAAAVAIVYNTGRFIPAKGLKQGYFDGSKYYGEHYFDYLRLAHTVAVAGAPQTIASPREGEAIMPPYAEPTASGAFLQVATQLSTLRLRRAPELSTPPRANVIAELPDGHPVRAMSARAVGGFRQVETMLGGALLQGYCFAKFLAVDAIRQPAISPTPSLAPATRAKSSPIGAALMPAVGKRITRRREPANALSLNEPGQPGRVGLSADALRAEIGAIIDWLGVDRPEFERYQPRNGLTFCNIYAHDFCHLAGAYLPRVWWTAKALIALSRGETVHELISATVDEVRANDLFRWLRDWGPGFGWRQSGSLDELQQAANQGSLGVIVARRLADGKSGHIVMVVPETEQQRARRNSAGEVLLPLQSQAGAQNFRYGMARSKAWWQGEEFAESAFWIHA